MEANNLAEEKLLITGGTGFVGRHILKTFLNENHSVVTFVRNKDKLTTIFGADLERKKLVVLETETATNLTSKDYKNIVEHYNITTIIHSAALAREYWRRPWSDYLKINVLWTENIANGFLEANVNHNTFIYTSTVGVYGTIPLGNPTNEETIYNPDGKYHTSKKMAEQKLIALKQHKNLPLLIFRPTIMYGDDDYGFTYNIFSLSKKGIFPLSKNLIIHLLDVKELAKVYSKFFDTYKNLDKKDYIFNVADEEPVGAYALLKSIEKWIDGGHIEIPSSLFSILLKLLKFNEQYSIKVKLITQSWFYDIDRLKRTGLITLGDTMDQLGKYVNWYKSNI